MARNSKVDLRHFPPPLAILRVQRALKDLRVGGTLEILLSDAETCLDMTQLLHPRVKGVVEVRPTGYGWWIRIKK